MTPQRHMLTRRWPQSIVQAGMVELYRLWRSLAFDAMGYPKGPGRGTPASQHSATGNVPATRASQEDRQSPIKKAHGRARVEGDDVVHYEDEEGKGMTTLSAMQMKRDWDQFVSAANGLAPNNAIVQRLYDWFVEKMTDALETEYELERMQPVAEYDARRDPALIESFIVNMFAANARQNRSEFMTHFDKDGIEDFITAKAEAMKSHWLTRFAQKFWDVQGSTYTRREKTDKIAAAMVINSFLKMKTAKNPDLRLRVNKQILADAKKVGRGGKGKSKRFDEKTTAKSKTSKVMTARAARAKGPKKIKGQSGTAGRTAVSPIALRNLLNEMLPKQVAKNMGSPALNFRTGRFANSARVDMVNVGPRGGISVDYDYMKNPYQTFEPGFKQGSTQRDPRKIIGASIREIAIGILGKQPHTIRSI